MRADSDNWSYPSLLAIGHAPSLGFILTISLMHSFDLKNVFALTEKVMVKLVPTSGCCNFGTWKTGDGGDNEAVDDQGESVNE